MLVSLPDAPGSIDPAPFAGPDHPMRKMTRQVAFDGGWNAERADRVAALFDSMAADWSETHVDETKAAPVRDAMARGDVPLHGSWLELGSGTGAGARVVHDQVGSLTVVDLSAEMLAHAPGLAPRVRADASSLPFGTDSFDALLLINMLLFPAEVDRVLRQDGRLVWINTLGDQTPIHLPPPDVVAALPGHWSGITARAGSGFWLVLSRSG